MKEEVQVLLTRARDLILSSIDGSSPPPNLDRFQDVCKTLLHHYQKTGKSDFFDHFYRLTVPLFSAYCGRVIYSIRANVEAQIVTNRMYALLFMKLTTPKERFPMKYLFPWCYRVIANFSREEKRRTQRRPGLHDNLMSREACHSMVEKLIRKEEEEEEEMRLQRILEILHAGEVGISARDREIMRLFYLEEHSLREIAEITGLTKSNIGVVLKRGREKIAKIIGSKKPPACGSGAHTPDRRG